VAGTVVSGTVEVEVVVVVVDEVVDAHVVVVSSVASSGRLVASASTLAFVT
jgi:hypothetical protein